MTNTNRIALIGCVAAIALGSAYAQADDKGMMGDKGMMMGKDSCPMMEAGAEMPAVTVQVEKTPAGAVLRITAKNTADATKVQELAAKMATHLEAGCPMMKHGEHEHGKGPKSEHAH